MENKTAFSSWHHFSSEKVFKELKSSPSGLSETEAEIRLKKFGPNLLPEEKKKNPFLIFLKQFLNIFNIVLFLVILLALAVDKRLDAGIVFLIILINATIGFYFEYQAERTLAELKKLFPQKTKVFREDKLKLEITQNIVPGDIILLEEGDIIPADVRFFEVNELKVNEASITGESEPVEKNKEALLKETIIPERKNMGFCGTYVLSGNGKGIIVAVGENTYFGQIYKKFEETQKEEWHFQKLAKDLILKMGGLALVSSFLIFFFGIFWQKEFFELLIFVATALVSAIPEGLPVILTLVLARGAYQLAYEKSLVKKLPSLANLSVCNLIITDKTQTLTEGIMTSRKVFLFSPPEKYKREEEKTINSIINNGEIIVSGEGWKPEGEFYRNKKIIDPSEDKRLLKLLHICAAVPDVKLIEETDNEQKEYKVLGDPTEGALVVLAEKGGVKKERLENSVTKKFPFNPELKCKGIIWKEKEFWLVGAFENIVKFSNKVLTKKGIEELKEKEKKTLLRIGEKYALFGFRVLGAGFSPHKNLAMSFKESIEPKELVFCGFVMIYDPPRPYIKMVVDELKNAGLEVKIATGDHKLTAINIAKETGLLGEVIEGEGLASLSQKEFLKTIKRVKIFCRTTPEIKLKILEGYKKLGYSPAYIGDGINDVLALKKADLGVGMGLRGSEVVRAASDIILLDDNFSTLISAIKQGRVIFNNIKRTSFFLVTTNIAEHITILLTIIIGWPLILLPAHILFINFITDTLVGTGLAFEGAHGYEMNVKPRSRKEKIITWEIFPFLLIIGVVMGFLTILLFGYYMGANLQKARTIAFLTMATTQIFNAFNLRSLKESVFKLGFLTNRVVLLGVGIALLLQIFLIQIEPLSSIFGFQPLFLSEWILIIFLSSSVLLVGSLYKILKNRN